MKIVCIYHCVDLDGWMSAAIVKHWFNYTVEIPNVKGAPINTLQFIGYNYGQPIPDLSEYDKVIMCDISFPIDEMEKLRQIYQDKFIWIDHHISAIKAADERTNNYYEGLRDTKFAACELTWQYFFPNEPMPEIIRLLGRYDCFGHRQIWKSVVGYEGLYEVSNQGNVRSLHKETKELSIANSKRGYRVVSLYKDGNATMKNVHQLVAKAFIPNPENKPCINHKDFNRLNNYVENLEWCTYAENNLHSIEEGKRGKTIIQLTKDGEFIQQFDSIIRAESHTGIASQNIGKVCKGERKFAGNYSWEYGVDKDVFPQFVPQDEEQKVLEFQYGARQCISNYEEAYVYLYKHIESSKGAMLSFDISIDGILNKGKAIYQYLCTEAKQAYKNGFEIFIGQSTTKLVDLATVPDLEEETLRNAYGIYLPFKFICINKERFNPINFGIDYHKDGYDGCACFHYANGMWHFSIYNDNGLVDCSVIAKQYGGGGHKGAAGFILNNANFNNLIFNSTLINYCIEVRRGGIGEEDCVLHHKFSSPPTKEDIEAYLISEDIGYDPKYCSYDCYQI